MANPRVNYVIATWDGKNWSPGCYGQRYQLDLIGRPMADEILAEHLRHLSKLKHHLSQITIMCATHHSRPKYENYYPNARKMANSLTFTCPIEWVETDKYTLYSYGQWFHAYEIFRDAFDYYIFTEDDIVGGFHYFDTVLMSLYQRRVPHRIGYVCTRVVPYIISKVSAEYDARLETTPHASISTGIINSKTLHNLFLKHTNIYNSLSTELQNRMPRQPFGGGDLMQVNFSLLIYFLESSVLVDYADVFLCPFWSRGSRIGLQHAYEDHSVLPKCDEFNGTQYAPLFVPVTMMFDENANRQSSERQFRLLDTLGSLLDASITYRSFWLFHNPEMVELDLSDQNLTNANLELLQTNRTLRYLNLSANSITDDFLENIQHIPLTCIILNDCNITEKGILTLWKHPTLTQFVVNRGLFKK